MITSKNDNIKLEVVFMYDGLDFIIINGVDVIIYYGADVIIFQGRG
jgi:hypothetical protein